MNLNVPLLPPKKAILFNLVRCYALLNKPDAAIGFLERSIDAGFDDFHLLETDPSLRRIRDRLPSRYRALCNSFVSTSPTLSDNAFALMKSGHISAACKLFHEELKSAPANSKNKILFNLARCYAQLNKYDAAMGFLIRSIDSGFRDFHLLDTDPHLKSFTARLPVYHKRIVDETPRTNSVVPASEAVATVHPVGLLQEIRKAEGHPRAVPKVPAVRKPTSVKVNDEKPTVDRVSLLQEIRKAEGHPRAVPPSEKPWVLVSRKRNSQRRVASPLRIDDSTNKTNFVDKSRCLIPGGSRDMINVESGLDILSAMGFHDEEQNRNALLFAGNDIGMAISRLLNKPL